MSTPLEISPNPLVNATIEIRIVCNKEAFELFPIIYQKVGDLFPRVREGGIPKELRIGQLEFAYDYILTNDDYAFSFSNKALSFEFVSSQYKTWKEYFPIIETTLGRIFDLKIVERVNRIGVRYMNIIEQASSLSEVLSAVPTLTFRNYTGSLTVYRTTLRIGENELVLNLADSAKVTKEDRVFSGVYVDTDSFYSLPLTPDKNTFVKIDELHSVGKEVFFDLLKPSFVQTLNPKYPNGNR